MPEIENESIMATLVSTWMLEHVPWAWDAVPMKITDVVP